MTSIHWQSVEDQYEPLNLVSNRASCNPGCVTAAMYWEMLPTERFFTPSTMSHPVGP